MLVIRQEQMEALGQISLGKFLNKMVAHCMDFSPRLCKVLGEEQLRVALSQAIDRADSYDFTFQGPTRFFIEMMLLFGSDFDSDPQYPWAAEILQKNDTSSQMASAEKLYRHTLKYLEKVVGPEDSYALDALKRISQTARQERSVSRDDFVPTMLHMTSEIYPQKAAYLGQATVKVLIQKAIDEASVYEISEPTSMALIYVLMLAFGHGCTKDPLYPWIERTLKNPRLTDSKIRAERLKKKSLTWLDHVIASFSEGEKT